MKKNVKPNGFLQPRYLCFCLVVFIIFIGCQKPHDPKVLTDFNQVNLVANNTEYHPLHIDPVLLNAWGLAFSTTGVAWVSSQAGHVSTVYDKEGATLRPPVNIPSPGGAIGGNPTGVVFNSSSDFVLSNGQPARFLFVGVDGILSGWNGAAGNNALLIKNNVATSAYTGLTLASNAGNNYLYAANFRGGKIDVWDKNFAPVLMSFKDAGLPAGYSPFNIQIVGNWLFVMYAKVGSDGRDQAGAGNGFVDIFNTDGSFVKRFASKGNLNAPWGVAQTPTTFFDDKDDEMDDRSGINAKNGEPEKQPQILIGNFGDGRINVYNINGKFLGQLKAHKKAITIEGLWALSFAPATATAIDPNRLYFTAGPDDEKNGLFGYIVKE